jgi:enoyl-CoA hydratase
MMTAEIFVPDQAVIAGFLDEVAPAEDVLKVAQIKAAQLVKLNMPAHAATKLRVREQTLSAMRKAIELDDATFRSRH